MTIKLGEHLFLEMMSSQLKNLTLLLVKFLMILIMPIFANSHYIAQKPTLETAMLQIKNDLKLRLDFFNRENVMTQRLDKEQYLILK